MCNKIGNIYSRGLKFLQVIYENFDCDLTERFFCYATIYIKKHYIPVGQYTSAYDGEVHAIKVALQQLTVYLDKFNNPVILLDSRAAIQSISQTF